MTVAEALTNLVFARVSTLKVYSDVFGNAMCTANSDTLCKMTFCEFYSSYRLVAAHASISVHAGPWSCGIGTIHFLDGWHTKPLNQALVSLR